MGDAGPYYANIKSGSGAVDNKMALCGYRRNGWIEFNLHHVKEGRMFVCEPTYGWKKPKTVGAITSGAEFKYNGKPVEVRTPPANDFDYKGKPRSVGGPVGCAEVLKKLNPGGGTFSIRAMTDEQM